MRGVIDRRILVNYRVDPEALAAVLPSPLRPKLVGDVGIGGICLIRLEGLRPRLVPRAIGLSSENAAHRIAVLLPDGGEGVFVPRRDTSSRLSALGGGRVFPGVHHRSRFQVEEQGVTYSLVLDDPDGQRLLSVRASVTDELPESSVFGSLAAASAFFEAGSIGYSATRDPAVLDGLELRTRTWEMQPLEVEQAYSSYFEDRTVFPEGSAVLDCALLMRGIDHEWHAREPLYCCETDPPA